MQETAFAAHERYCDRRFFGSLNGIRFLCIAAVIWHHGPLLGEMAAPGQFLQRGFTGVDFFFVLSGYLITTLLLREEARTGRISLVDFYRRRLLRIVPVYFFVVSMVAFYFIVLKGQTEYLGHLPYYYLFFSNMLTDHMPFLSITWSLSVEEQYYLIWPALLVLWPAMMRWRISLLVGLIALCVASSLGGLAFLGLRPIETPIASWEVSTSGFSAILIGTLLAAALHARRSFVMLYAVLGARVAPLVALAAVGGVLALAPGVLLGWPNLVLHSAMAATIGAVVVREDNILRPVLAWRPIARVGEISYGIYLYHVIGRFFVETGLAPFGWSEFTTDLWVTLIYPFVAIAMAEISFRTLERFFLTLKDRSKQPASA